MAARKDAYNALEVWNVALRAAMVCAEKRIEDLERIVAETSQ